MANSERITYLKNELEKRILILDGAMGSLLQTYRLTEADFRGNQFADHPCELKGYNDLLSITQPHIVREIHANYCSAGADIIETNTFTSTSVSMADYQLQDIAYQVNYAAACKSLVKSQINGHRRVNRVSSLVAWDLQIAAARSHRT